MNVAAQIAEHFNAAEDALFFDECSYFTMSRSCTVRFNGQWFDVWFDDAYNIASVVDAN